MVGISMFELYHRWGTRTSARVSVGKADNLKANAGKDCQGVFGERQLITLI